MSLSDYDGLKAEIVSYLARSDVTAGSAIIDSFIHMAEAEFNKRLRVMRMQKNTTLAVSGDATLPMDFVQIVSLSHQNAPYGLSYVTQVDRSNETGRPRAYSIGWRGDRYYLKFLPQPASEYNLDIIYYSRIPALSGSNTTNWLLTDYPELYLNACLYYAFKRYRSPLAADYKALFGADIETLNQEDEHVQTGGGGTSIKVQGTIV